MWHQPRQGAFRSRSCFVGRRSLMLRARRPGRVRPQRIFPRQPRNRRRPGQRWQCRQRWSARHGGSGHGRSRNGGAATGGQADTAGPGVDPAVSAAWQWTPCGTLGSHRCLSDGDCLRSPDGGVGGGLCGRPGHPAFSRSRHGGPGADRGRTACDRHSLLAQRETAGGSAWRRCVAAPPSGRAGAGDDRRDGGRLRHPDAVGLLPRWQSAAGRSAGAICVWRTDSAALVAMATEAFTAAALTNSSVVVGRRLSTGGLAVEALALPSLTRTTIPVQPAAAPALTDPNTLVISPTGDSFVAIVRTDTDRSLMLWDGAGATLVTRSLGESRPVVFSPDGRHVLLSDAIVNASTGAIERHLPTSGGVSGGPVPTGDVECRWHATGGLEHHRYAQGTRRLRCRLGHELRVFATLPSGPPQTVDRAAMGHEHVRQWAASGNFGPGELDVVPDRPQLRKIRGDSVRRQVCGAVSNQLVPGRRRCCSVRVTVGPSAGLLRGRSWTPSRRRRSVSLDYCTWSLGSLSPRGTWLVDRGCLMDSSIFAKHRCLRIRPRTVPSARCDGRAAFNADESLMATTGPELYRTSDWTRIWPATVISPVIQGQRRDDSPFGDVQFLPGGRELLISLCGRPVSDDYQLLLRAVFRGHRPHASPVAGLDGSKGVRLGGRALDRVGAQRYNTCRRERFALWSWMASRHACPSSPRTGTSSPACPTTRWCVTVAAIGRPDSTRQAAG